MRIGAGSPQPAPGALFLFFRRSALLIHFRPSRPSSRDGFSNSFDERQLVVAGFYSMPQFKLNKASCTSADIFPPSPFPPLPVPSARQRRKASKARQNGEIECAECSFNGIVAAFRVELGTGAGGGGSPIVIHKRYPRGILNITRADKRRRRRVEENGQERLRMARGGELRLGLKIARQRCRSARDARSGIEIMVLRLVVS